MQMVKEKIKRLAEKSISILIEKESSKLKFYFKVG